jgi:hypothetical protein
MSLGNWTLVLLARGRFPCELPNTSPRPLLDLAPAHAVYFGVWEACKRQFIGPGHRGDELNSLQSGAAGICATVRPRAAPFVPILRRSMLDMGLTLVPYL